MVQQWHKHITIQKLIDPMNTERPDFEALREKALNYAKELYPMANVDDYPDNPNVNRINNNRRSAFMSGYDYASKTISEQAESIKELSTEIEKLKTFKSYVHDRLDAMGIEVDPESPHKEAGCRIGGRLDIVEKIVTDYAKNKDI